MELNYVPRQGDICYIDFAPTKGHEQSGVGPAIVISRFDYNKFTNMVVLCPITSNIKKFPTHYELISSKKVKGSVLCEHIRSIDFKARKISFVERISDEELKNIIDLMTSIVEI